MAALAGCVVGDEAAGGGDLRSDVRPESPIPANGLVLDPELAAQLPTGPLGSRDANGRVTLAPGAAAVFDSAAGRALMKYVAICALPVTDAITLDGQRLPGYYGLAPDWVISGCDGTCQRWVSACVLAHANKQGTPVQISIRGAHQAFTWESKILAAHTYEEAAFYGNLFERELYACMGHGLFDGRSSEGDGNYFLQGRVCGYTETCGLSSLGMCFSTVPDLELRDAVCDRQPIADGGYGDCHYQSGEGPPRTSPVIREVVTVYLAP